MNFLFPEIVLFEVYKSKFTERMDFKLQFNTELVYTVTEEYIYFKVTILGLGLEIRWEKSNDNNKGEYSSSPYTGRAMTANSVLLGDYHSLLDSLQICINNKPDYEYTKFDSPGCNHCLHPAFCHFVG